MGVIMAFMVVVSMLGGGLVVVTLVAMYVIGTMVMTLVPVPVVSMPRVIVFRNSGHVLILETIYAAKEPVNLCIV